MFCSAQTVLNAIIRISMECFPHVVNTGADHPGLFMAAKSIEQPTCTCLVSTIQTLKSTSTGGRAALIYDILQNFSRGSKPDFFYLKALFSSATNNIE